MRQRIGDEFQATNLPEVEEAAALSGGGIGGGIDGGVSVGEGENGGDDPPCSAFISIHMAPAPSCSGDRGRRCDADCAQDIAQRLDGTVAGDRAWRERPPSTCGGHEDGGGGDGGGCQAGVGGGNSARSIAGRDAT